MNLEMHIKKQLGAYIVSTLTAKTLGNLAFEFDAEDNESMVEYLESGEMDFDVMQTVCEMLTLDYTNLKVVNEG